MERTVRVDGLTTRYLEAGEGPPVLLLHGASLGSSADVWEGVLPQLAGHGFRAIALDQPGFGLTDNPSDHSLAYRRGFVLQFMDALRLQHAHVIGHSQSGAMAVALALEHPGRIASVTVVGTGSLLPPPPDSVARGRAERLPSVEPSVEDVRALLESQLFNHSLITMEVLERRHRMSTGKNFEAFLARQRAEREDRDRSIPLWERLNEIRAPLLFVYGEHDQSFLAQRIALLEDRYPWLEVHILPRARHLVHWDAAEEFVALVTQFLSGATKEVMSP